MSTKKVMQVTATTLFIGVCFWFGATHNAAPTAEQIAHVSPASAPVSCAEITAGLDSIGDFFAQHFLAILFSLSFGLMCFVNGLVLFFRDTYSVVASIVQTLKAREG